MPTIIDPATGHPQTLVTGIYIARGEETLGPYDSAAAAALVRVGYLRADDHAARHNDAAWVPLADFLLPDDSPRAGPPPAPAPAASASEAHPHRWRQMSAAFIVLLAVPLLVVGGVRWWENRHAAAVPPAVVPRPQPVVTPVAAAPVPPPPAVVEASPVPPPPAPAEPAGPVQGIVSLALTDGDRDVLAGVRVAAYPLAALETALAPATAAAQAARERLDPQIAAAAAECSTRSAEEQATLQAWREAAPADPMRPSLRFAYEGARTAARTAGDNYRYLIDERTATAGGEVYFHDLPEPAISTEIDAGGSFTLTLPADDEAYVVAASVRPTAGDGSARTRYWLVRLSPAQRSGREPLRLDAGNFTASDAAGSLVHTAD